MKTHTLALQEVKANAPPKPTDPLGRLVSWVKLVAVPGFHYEGRWTIIDADWIDLQVQEYERFQDGQYTAPVHIKHLPNPEGKRFGDVLRLARWQDEEGAEYLIGAVAWALKDPQTSIDIGQLRYLSPGFARITDERGRHFPFVLNEISIVPAPHQKGMGHTHIIAGEQTMADPVAEPTIEVGTSVEDRVLALEDQMSAVVQGQAQILSAIEGMKTPKPVPEPEVQAAEDTSEDKPAEEDEEKTELSELKAQVAQLQEQAFVSDFNTGYPEGHVVQLSGDKVRKACQTLARACPEAFAVLANATVQMEETLDKEPAPVIPTPPLTSIAWGSVVGLSETMEDSGLSPEDILAQAQAEAKGDATKTLAIYKRKQNL